jgi:hypothetical protein
MQKKTVKYVTTKIFSGIFPSVSLTQKANIATSHLDQTLKLSRTNMGDSDDIEEYFSFIIQNYLQEGKVHGGSLGQWQHCNCGYEEGHSRIMHDYFDTDPIYNDQLFIRRF